MMAQDPALLRAFARHLVARAATAGHPHVSVRAEAHAALNGHAVRRVMDSNEELASSAGAALVTTLR
jgi:hypothetical protein